MTVSTLLLAALTLTADQPDSDHADARPLPFATEYVTGRVVRVTEADTLRIRIRGEVYPVQLTGVRDLDRAHPYYPEALQLVQRALRGHEVRVRMTSWVGERRLLMGDVWLGGQNLAEELIEAGLVRNGWADNPRRERLELLARQSHSGLWQQADRSAGGDQLAAQSVRPQPMRSQPMRSQPMQTESMRTVSRTVPVPMPTQVVSYRAGRADRVAAAPRVNLPLRIAAPSLSDSRIESGVMR